MISFLATQLPWIVRSFVRYLARWACAGPSQIVPTAVLFLLFLLRVRIRNRVRPRIASPRLASAYRFNLF